MIGGGAERAPLHGAVAGGLISATILRAGVGWDTGFFNAT